eukprot:TRINITY_DN2872_c0_g1_i4.p1 TRINITY_DN2872_c0_g1~~TRINITY_DN2872_c0_g1_i4.p1  ORF type:complete len:400 (+),score=66.80 TRINITY_DN2872_c0_g1_i4:181-1380(+)
MTDFFYSIFDFSWMSQIGVGSWSGSVLNIATEAPMRYLVGVPVAILSVSVPLMLYRKYNIKPKHENHLPSLFPWKDKTAETMHKYSSAIQEIIQNGIKSQDLDPKSQTVKDLMCTMTVYVKDQICIRNFLFFFPLDVNFLERMKVTAKQNDKSDSSILISYGLGFMLATGLAITFLTENFTDLGLYLCSISSIHLLEYLFMLTFHPKDCSSLSFLPFQSLDENLALLVPFGEYFCHKMLFPHSGPTFLNYSSPSWLVYLGRTRISLLLSKFLQNKSTPKLYVPFAIATIFFQGIRISAMWTAGFNYHHQLRDVTDVDQRLVTWGVYSWSRHPSYFGYFWWAISTQIMLANPLCLLFYLFFFGRTFYHKIKHEEETLVRDFGRLYLEYKNRVGVGIPFVR